MHEKYLRLAFLDLLVTSYTELNFLFFGIKLIAQQAKIPNSKIMIVNDIFIRKIT